mgnify:CR=1 FL=1
MKKNTITSLAALAAMALCAAPVAAQTKAPLGSPMPHRGLKALKLADNHKQDNVQTVRQLKSRAPQATLAPSLFYGRTFYGSLINSTDWASASITQVPYGIYSFEIGDNIAPQAVMTDLSYNFLSGAYTGDKFIGIYAMEVMGGLNGARYITIDPATKTELKNIVYDTSKGGYSLLPSTMAYNNIDNTIYSLQYNDDLSGLNWSRYNTDYDWMDKIAAFRGKYNVLTLGNTPDGEMYFINVYGDLYRINRANGRPSLIAWTGITPQAYSQSMTYDNRTGLFLWAAISDEGNCLYSVDPETAQTELVAKFGKQEQFTSIYSLEESAKDDAPAKVGDLKLNFAQAGGLDGTITFTVPTKTYAGATLGTSTLNVWLDGQNLKGVEAQPGEQVSIPVSLAEGNHYVAVNSKNATGWSPLASLKLFAGFDTPEAPAAVSFANADGTSTVTWSAPAAGVNKGYIDPSALTYTVVRMPDSVTVADQHAGTTFTEPTPAALHSYSYRVYATNHGKRSTYGVSNKVTCGDAFTTPYRQAFDSQQTFDDYFTVIDNDSDGTIWKYQEYGSIVRFDLAWDSKKQADDWLITPAISLQGGKNYRATVNLKTFSKGYPEYFDLLLGTDPKDITTFHVFNAADSVEIYETYSDYSATFNAPATGKYYVALRYRGDKSKNSSMLLLKSFAVDEVGNTQAPAAASGLKVIPGEDDKMEATVSFTTPQSDLNGDPLSEIAKVNVYRNDEAEPVHVFEAPATNALLSWTDTKVKRVGMNTYRVKAANAYGEGAAAVDSAFVGCYETPYLETFTTRASAEHYTVQMQGVDEANKDYYRWKYDENNQRMNIYAFNGQADNTLVSWLITPLVKLNANSVYALAYKKNFSRYINYNTGTYTVEGNVFMGQATDSASLTTPIGELKPNANYGMEDGSNRVVTKEAGKYCFGFNIVSTAQYDNIMADIDDVSLTYVKSAFAPLEIANLKAVADSTGALAATLSFDAPATDYQGTRLSDNLTVNVYRGNSSIPVYTQTDVIPGSPISWTDTEAQHGQNQYSVIAENQYGRSEVATGNLFVGLDRPSKVEQLAIHGSADNQQAVITWQAPESGHNGGVVVKDNLTYRVLQYNADERTLTVVADDVKGLTYTVDRSDLNKQEVLYYGVVAKNTEGIGDTVVTNCTIGKLYTLPFHESFAERQLSTTPWIISSENTSALNWGTTCPTGEQGSYNLATPQDGDDGCAYFYNGSYYETYAGAGFISPKVAMDGKHNYLSFWIYNYAPQYDKHPYVVVYVRADDGQYTQVASYDIATADSTEGWKQYRVDLSDFKDNHFASFAFYAYTAGHLEAIYLDNILVGDEEATAIRNITADGTDKAVKRIEWFDLNGRSVNAPAKGVYLMKSTYSDGSQKTVKVVK